MVNPVPAATVYEDSFWITGDNWLYSLELQSFAVEYNRRMTLVGQSKISLPYVGTGDDIEWYQSAGGVSPIKIWQEVLKAIYDEYVDWKNGAFTYDGTHYIDATHYGTIRWTTGADSATVTNWSSLGTTALEVKKIYDAANEARDAIDGMYASHDAWTLTDDVMEIPIVTASGFNSGRALLYLSFYNPKLASARSSYNMSWFPHDISYSGIVYYGGVLIDTISGNYPTTGFLPGGTGTSDRYFFGYNIATGSDYSGTIQITANSTSDPINVIMSDSTSVTAKRNITVLRDNLDTIVTSVYR